MGVGKGGKPRSDPQGVLKTSPAVSVSADVGLGEMAFLVVDGPGEIGFGDF